MYSVEAMRLKQIMVLLSRRNLVSAERCVTVVATLDIRLENSELENDLTSLLFCTGMREERKSGACVGVGNERRDVLTRDLLVQVRGAQKTVPVLATEDIL